MTLEQLIAAYTASGGKLTGTDLITAGNIAWSQLFQQTFGRLASCDAAEHTEAITNCFTELVDMAHKRSVKGVLSSETVDDWSQSYSDPDAGKSDFQVYSGIITRWLVHTDLLYRGCP